MAGGDGGVSGCGCKGIRSCLLCEAADRELLKEPPQIKSFTYIPKKGIALGVENTDSAGWWFSFPGVCLIEDFVTEDEETEMVHTMDLDEWRLSQSGRRKQDFGPKVNFKKQKVKFGSFTGLPDFSKVLWERMKTHAVLEGFLPVEQCNLDYNSDRGSAIDSHYDDSWLWGERLVSLNLLSDTVLTMSNSSTDLLQLFSSANLSGEPTESSHLNNAQCGLQDSAPHSGPQTALQDSAPHSGPQTALVPCSEVEVAICLPRRSLVVLYGKARYSWKHAIHRQHIKQRRICSTFRELSAEFMRGGTQEKLGQTLLEIALGFQGKSV
ncbi:alpha-ketoglutarate-dependent dioxygenase alkB homolog 4 isoform X2 [Rana temporaria]|uniref:alpha-ketoglutarate-dependent dioxygenase alkB homolog 4 isoform X2 n=1 Tax=Rana temporaria TaxID=8407 RepID=UPI001AAD617E|nr:alpha-ketoglutarate-dependent dioxygenase alkB homolog 4 isoform X2 [Rana temporaria]